MLRRNILWIPSVVLFAIVARGSAPSRADEPASTLPIDKVVLYSSGVGFFEHNAEIEGDSQVNLNFNVEDVNDLLKSMVLQDFGGGKISTVTYGSQDPIAKTLKTFAIDLTTSPSLSDLLKQVRGEQIEVESSQNIIGTIVGLEKRPQAVKETVVETDYINLLTDTGLRSLPLESITRIKFVNQALDAEFRQALRVLALGHATDKKSVTLNFLGQGKRPVRVGYIQEAPLWKTSYRLVLDDEKTPYLQGWAIVENSTEEDWKNVNLTLVSGRPISFIMDLYAPLYVRRPVVEPELFASLRPQTYGQDLAAADKEFAEKAAAAPPAPVAGGGIGGGHFGRASMGGMPGDARDGRELRRELDLAQGAQSLAAASELGELFEYKIESPVTLPRQQSAMLAIVNDSVEGRKVSIYNPAVHPKHPLNGLKLTNSTGLHLMQGPITVFDDGAYAGDAQIQDLPPGTERLISYAVDLDVEVAPESRPGADELLSVKISKGTLLVKRKYRREQKYVAKNSGKKVKELLIEYPADANWTLIEPKEPAEKTRDLYRFAVQAQPGKSQTLAVREEQLIDQQIELTNLAFDTILLYAKGPAISDKAREALDEVVRRRQAIDAAALHLDQLNGQIATISTEQARIRENMAQLERNSQLYNRYVKKFTEQEDTIESLRDEIEAGQAKLEELRKDLESYLLGLTIE